MRRTRVKICGLTREEDVVAAVEAGADACGFIFAESPRRVSVERAAELAALVPPPVARVGVFVNASRDEIEAAVAVCGLTAVQLSGVETPQACDGLGVPVIKMVQVGTDFDWKAVEPYRGHAAALLLDTYDPHKAGGTSQTFAWSAIGEILGGVPCFVAGGLTPSNVGGAIAAMRPFAVDVSSGVESSPGVKDAAKVSEFCAAVRAADLEVHR